MDFDSGVKSATERMDFEGVFAGASKWFPTKGHALTVQAAFQQWDKERRTKLIATIEKTFFDDPAGRGYRLHWSQGATVVRDDGIEAWANDRLVVSGRRPASGWHLISELYGDYLSHTEGRAPISIVKFSGVIASMSGVQRERVARGSVAIGLCFKDEATIAPVETDLRAALEKQQRELEAMGYGRLGAQTRPATLAELLKREGSAQEPVEIDQSDEGGDDEDEARSCATCAALMFADMLDDNGDCQKCGLTKRLRSE